MNRIKLTLVMLTWGSIGLLTRYIDMTAVSLAFYRALIAVPVLLIFWFSGTRRRKMSLSQTGPYIISGMMIGLAWYCLFNAFNHTDVSLAVLIYNMCPVYVLILSPIVLKEKMGIMQKVTVVVSFVGLAMLLWDKAILDKGNFIGIGSALMSGILYAVIVLINRKSKDLCDSVSATAIQMSAATAVMLPIGLIERRLNDIFSLSPMSLTLLLVLGIVHTAFAYLVYFSSYQHLKGIEVVSFSYLEPLFSILLAMLFLGERMNRWQIIGGIIILGMTYYNEYSKRKIISEAQME